MDLATLCTFVASLQVVPNRSQFFQYENVSLSCGSNWTIMRNTSKHVNQRSLRLNKSSWSFSSIYWTDSGVYWCQSEEGECGAAVNITVTAGSVILESPVQPVTEGDRVKLQCIIDPNNPTAERTFQFFKDGFWIKNSSSGEMSLSSVSVNDSGLYTCRCGGELSTERPLQVTARNAGQPPKDSKDAKPNIFNTPTAFDASTALLLVVLPVVGACVALICLALICLRKKRKEREKHDVYYSNVDVVNSPEPHRFKDMKPEDESTFYSTLQLNFM